MAINQDQKTIQLYFSVLTKVIANEKKNWGDAKAVADMIALTEKTKRIPVNNKFLYEELIKFFQFIYINTRLGLLDGVEVSDEELTRFFTLLNKHREENNLELFPQKKIDKFMDFFYENFATSEEIKERKSNQNSVIKSKFFEINTKRK